MEAVRHHDGRLLQHRRQLHLVYLAGPAVMAVTAEVDLAQLAEHVRELTEHHQHQERYYVMSESRNRQWRQHTTWQASLLDQLRMAAVLGGHGEVGGNRPKGKRTPAPANLDAIDRLQAITTGVRDWMKRFGLSARSSLEYDLRSLVGAAGTADKTYAGLLASDVDRWRLWCLTLSGWRIPPWRPNAPCPRCDAMPTDKAGLRVRLDRATACCVSPECGATWTPDTVGILADYVRSYGATGGAA